MADVTDATFQTQVIERSMQVPVVVDLWAPWCGPCKQLGPIIEKVIADTNGKVELAKVNVDENQQVAGAFQVQGIPAVFAIKDGAVVDSFVGAKGEREVAEFVNKLVPSNEETAIEQLVAAGDEASLRTVLEAQPDHPEAVTKLAAILADRGEAEAVDELLARIPESPETRRIAAIVRTGGDVGGDDVDAKLTSLLDRVKTDEEARQEYVDILEVLGPDDPRTADYRKQLTSRLF